MSTKNKSNSVRKQRDTHMPPVNPGKKNKNQTNTSDNMGEINRGNSINLGTNRRTHELHSKNSVTGSDNDGQAE